MMQYFFITILLCQNLVMAEPKKVYVYNNKNFHDYFLEQHEFFVRLFGKKFNVIPTKTLRNLKNVGFIVTNEVPHNQQEWEYLFSYPKNKVLLFSFETQISNPKSHDPVFHRCYGKIFTWNDDLIDNKKYFKVRFPWMDPRGVLYNTSNFATRKMCVFVANNFRSSSAYENYTERKRITEFFEQYHPDDLDLFGYHWPAYTVLRGTISIKGDRRMNKISVLSRYRFDLCYENTIHVNGWVSERIFEAFAAGCIPVYLGTDNIEKYIPKGCYISRKDFSDNEAMYAYMASVTQADYECYINNIRQFLASGAAYKLSTEYYLQSITKILGLGL